MQFVARQPVFDRNMRVYGYELLFRRNSGDQAAHITDADHVSRQVVDTSLIMGLDTLCDGVKAFLNCTREVLITNVLEVLPPQFVVAEVLENVVPDEEITAACESLSQKGYLIALDDVISLAKDHPLRSFVNIIKVDFRQTTREQQLELVRHYGPLGISMLAEKVETHEEYLDAMRMGYDYFQGYFFQRPHIVYTHEISAFNLNHLRLLAAVQRPEPDLSTVEELIKEEPALSYRLLRYLNSPLFTLELEVTSVRHAVMLLGTEEMRRWVSVVALLTMGGNKPQGTVLWALVRARYCELLGRHVPGQKEGAFLLGLLSSLPTLLDSTMESVLARIAASPEIKAALLGEQNRWREIYELALAYEAGDWDQCAVLGDSLGLSESRISESYMEAVKWAQMVTHSDSAPSGQGA